MEKTVEVRNAKIYPSEVGCGKILNMIGFKDKEMTIPHEFYIQGDGCDGNHKTIGVLMAAVLQKRPIEWVIEHLKKVSCTSCARMKGALPKEERGGIPNSCGDAIRRAFEQAYKKQEEK